MASKLLHIKNLRRIFLKSVESVKPHNLLSAANNYQLRPVVKDKKETIQIQGRTLDITGKQCHLVGFGKAILGMAVQLEKQLTTRLASGVISIPKDSLQQFKNVPHMQLKEDTCIEVFEGAPNNQPDSVAMEAALKIRQTAFQMTENDILFVLISGGGSALLPYAKHLVRLVEKTELVHQLANRGATIEEMNVVRIALSDIKGGKLSTAAQNAHAVISFVISDIVGDPVDLIASGPTCKPLLRRISPRDILQKYDLWKDLADPVRLTINNSSSDFEGQPRHNNSIYIVGDNRVATATAVQEALECGYNPFIASTTITGDLNDVVEMYKKFLKSIYRYRCKEIEESELKEEFPFDPRIFQHFLKTLQMCEKTKKPLLLILAGEPTVKVTGKGLGGRNQELALRLALEFYEDPSFSDICFLSAGTDGIDGPTNAAGAIGSSLVIEDFLNNQKTLTDLKTLLSDNDSYNFYKSLSEGKYHVVTGHTGTNVMDLHLIVVP